MIFIKICKKLEMMRKTMSRKALVTRKQHLLHVMPQMANRFIKPVEPFLNVVTLKKGLPLIIKIKAKPFLDQGSQIFFSASKSNKHPVFATEYINFTDDCGTTK